MTKTALRRQIKQDLAAMSDQRRRSESADLTAWLKTWMANEGFECLLATLPLPGEPDLLPLYRHSITQGRALALAMTDQGARLTFGLVGSLDGPWVEKPGGLREPQAGAVVWKPGPKTLCLVPGLAFARHPAGGAQRLGRGGGYYDRWLAQFSSTVFSLGIGFGCQSLDDLPQEAHDVALDAWLDPRGLHGLDGGPRTGG